MAAEGEVLVDGRWLEPPEPMERVLAALKRLRPGEHVRFLIHREPFPLFAMLASLGYGYRSRAVGDDFEVLIEPLTANDGESGPGPA